MKKRVLSFVLCICLLSSLTVLFSACGKKTIDLNEGYQVVYTTDVSDSMVARITEFTDTLKQKSGKDIKVTAVKSEGALESAGELEILVGNTVDEEFIFFYINRNRSCITVFEND